MTTKHRNQSAQGIFYGDVYTGSHVNQLGRRVGNDQYIAGRDVTVIHQQPQLSEYPIAPRDRRDLLTLLERRYTNRLEDMFELQARTALNLRTNPDTVDPAWRQHLRGMRSGQAIPQGTPIIDVFDKAGGQLLILGAPGAGKTTLLLELAQALLHRAQADPNEPIAVVVNLSTWGAKAVPLARWLPDVLNAAADIGQPFAKSSSQVATCCCCLMA